MPAQPLPCPGPSQPPPGLLLPHEQLHQRVVAGKRLIQHRRLLICRGHVIRLRTRLLVGRFTVRSCSGILVNQVQLIQVAIAAALLRSRCRRQERVGWELGQATAC